VRRQELGQTEDITVVHNTGPAAGTFCLWSAHRGNPALWQSPMLNAGGLMGLLLIKRARMVV